MGNICAAGGCHESYGFAGQYASGDNLAIIRFGSDSRAEAMGGDARALPFADKVFDWVGMHFVVYFLFDMRAGLQEAWRLVAHGGAELFPSPPEVYRWPAPAGFRFDEADAVVRYLAAGPIRKHVGDCADDVPVRKAALAWIRQAMDRHIARHGVFMVWSPLNE